MNTPKQTDLAANRLWRVGNLVLGAGLLVFIPAQCVVAASLSEETAHRPRITDHRIPD